MEIQNKTIYQIKVIPLVIKKEEKIQDNLSQEEIESMSCDPRMLWRMGNNVYLSEMPLTYKGTKVKSSLYYVYNELTKEEQEKYKSRSTTITVTKNKIEKINESKKRRLIKKKN